MKLMDIDADTLNIPETEYDARVTMLSAEFGRIVRDLSQLGESVRIEVSKEGVRFASDGEAANGSVLLPQSDGSHISGTTIKPQDRDGKEDEKGDDDEVTEGGSSSKKTGVKREKNDDDVEMDDEEGNNEEEEFKPPSGDEGEEEQDQEENEEEGSGSKKRKKVNDFTALLSPHPYHYFRQPAARNPVKSRKQPNQKQNQMTALLALLSKRINTYR
jgi:proliferating cell nuclear antigen